MAIEVTKITPADESDLVWITFEINDPDLSARLNEFFLKRFRAQPVAKTSG